MLHEIVLMDDGQAVALFGFVRPRRDFGVRQLRVHSSMQPRFPPSGLLLGSPWTCPLPLLVLLEQ